jgi:tagatose 1,6-diphosphate aldolase
MQELSVGKLIGLQKLSRDGFFTITAMDHRGSLKKMLNPKDPEAVRAEDIIRFKLGVSKFLAPESTGILLDPEYGIEPAARALVIPPHVGLIVSLEESGYSGPSHARKSSILEGWSVGKIKRLGVQAVKMLVYFNPESHETRDSQMELVKRVGEECRELDIPFICEPMSYALQGEKKEGDANFAKKKALMVIETARLLTPLGIDVLKAEFPDEMQFEKDRSTMLHHCRGITEASRSPWILLSAGASFEEFKEMVAIACEAGASGFLAGRAVWQDALKQGSMDRIIAYLGDQGVKNLRTLNDIVRRKARPWWDFYGGRKAIEESTVGEGWFKAYSDLPLRTAKGVRVAESLSTRDEYS